MALLKAQVVLKHTNGLPEDVTVNTFHFSTADVAAGTLTDISDALADFYTVTPVGPPAGAGPLSSFFSTEMAQNGHEVKLYNLADASPRVPIGEYQFSLPAAPNGDPLPAECAVVLSFQGDKVSGEPQSRKRGRIYLGRLDKDCASGGRPSSSLMTALASAAEDLMGRDVGNSNWAWIVYSPAYNGLVKDVDGDLVPHPTREAYAESWSPVTNGWVDNAFDTQRRRGLAATARTTFPS